MKKGFFKTAAAFIIILSMPLSHVSAATADEQAALDGAEVDASIFLDGDIAVTADGISVSAPSAILMEKSTGKVIYEKEADERLRPASVTKVMTMLLIVEAVEDGTISLEDTVPVSARAASMGGSQVFLEEGERMKADEMLKCIVVSSANDAAVAMAEFICGTEEAFVARMNERAAQLGMEHTVFTNCTGLFDDPLHLTTARDVAIMSRELIMHEWIKEYTTIWMDTIRNGAFGLSSTNKLIYYYDGATGLKTGFTSSAGYCLSATAERNGVEYIAAVMHCDTSANRFDSAKTLLSYGFANYTLASAAPEEVLPLIPVKLGMADCVQPVLLDEEPLLIRKTDAPNITKTVELASSLTAPVLPGQEIGMLTVYNGQDIISRRHIIAADGVERSGWQEILIEMLSLFFFGS